MKPLIATGRLLLICSFCVKHLQLLPCIEQEQPLMSGTRGGRIIRSVQLHSMVACRVMRLR
eukprot:gene5878-biopygen13397